MPSQPDGRDDLARALRALRKAAGLSGVEAGRRIGQTQASISRFENGRFVPTPEAVEALCRAYGASATERRWLVQIARDVREDMQPAARAVIQRGAARMQERIGRVERRPPGPWAGRGPTHGCGHDAGRDGSPPPRVRRRRAVRCP